MRYQEQTQAGRGEGPMNDRLELENNLRGQDLLTVVAMTDDSIGSRSDEELKQLVQRHVQTGSNGRRPQADRRAARVAATGLSRRTKNPSGW